MKEDLSKELHQRGTAEIGNRVVNQATQSLNETDETAEFLIFGELKKVNVKTILVACAECKSGTWKRIGSQEACREFQKKDALARGFIKVICPQQFID